jgi:predicted RNA methylase
VTTRQRRWGYNRRVQSTDAIASSLRRGNAVTDLAFDRVFPLELRTRSAIEWTPVAVAVRVAKLLAGAARVLDVGAGAGKACFVGALAGEASWHGIEQDERLVAASIEAARALAIGDRARVVYGDALSADWTGFDAIYLFNPFGRMRPTRTFGRFTARANPTQVRRTQAKLAELRAGTRVLTYHGLGGDAPDVLERVASERAASGTLELYTRRAV